MSLSNYTRNILNIKNENIIFEENWLKEIKIKGVITKVFHGILTYTPTVCPHCICIYKSNPNYTKLKKYWKLILKDKRDLDKNKKIYQKCFRKEMSQYDIVTYLLSTNEELYETYKVYQSIIYSINTRNKDIFLNTINKPNKKVSKYMKKAIKTFKNMEQYIVNAFDYEYSNGIVEGTNNLIKQVKHAVCGYRKFSHLKARIMLIKGLYNPIKA